MVRDLQSKTGVTVQESPLNKDTLQKVLSDTHVLIHCTPMGMSPNVDGTPVPATLLHAELTVMDIVYNPRDTQLLKDAKAAGCQDFIVCLHYSKQ